MTKKEKIWLWVSTAVFFVPIILFSFSPTRTLIMDEYLYDNEFYLLSALVIIIIGNLSLLFFNIKINNRLKHAITVFLCLTLVFFVFVFYTAFYMRNGIGF